MKTYKERTKQDQSLLSHAQQRTERALKRLTIKHSSLDI
jgi:hypothetical protein